MSRAYSEGLKVMATRNFHSATCGGTSKWETLMGESCDAWWALGGDNRIYREGLGISFMWKMG